MMCMLDLTSKLFTLLVIAYLCTTNSDDNDIILKNNYLKEASILLKFLTLGQVLTGILLYYIYIFINLIIIFIRIWTAI
jgi:hypothetical protein